MIPRFNPWRGAIGIGKTGGFGAAVAYNAITNDALATIDGSSLLTPGALALEADSDATIESISLGVGGGKSVGLAGSASVNLIDTTAAAQITNSPDIDATGAISLIATDDSKIRALAGGVGGAQTAAIGAAVAVNEIGDRANPDSGVFAVIENSDVATQADLTLKATTTGTIATISAGGAGAQTVALGGAVSVNDMGRTLQAEIIDSKADIATDLTLAATDTSTIQSLAGNVSGAGTAAIGASVAQNFIGNTLTTGLEGATVTANTATVEATSTATIQSIAAGGQGAGDFALGGSITLNEIDTTVESTIIGSGATIANDLLVQAMDTAKIESLAGNVQGAGTAAIGASLATNDIGNQVNAGLDQSTVEAQAAQIAATADGKIKSLAVGGAIAGQAALNGSITLNEIDNDIQAYLTNQSQLTTTQADTPDGAALQLEARDTAQIQSLAGSVVGASVAAIGVAAATNDIGNNVTATIQESTADSKGGSVSLDAHSKGEIQSLSAGVSVTASKFSASVAGAFFAQYPRQQNRDISDRQSALGHGRYYP